MANIVDIIIKGKDQSKKALTAPIKNLKDLKTAAKTLGPAFKLGVTAAVGALGVLVKRAISVADEAKKVSDRLGITTEALTTLRFAAEQAGVGAQTFDIALQRFTRRTAEAANGTGEAKAALEELGIQLKDGEGNLKSNEVLLKEVADSLKGVENQQDKVRLAFKLFDTEGVKLLNLLDSGSAGMEEMQKKARALGLEIDSNTAKAAEDFTNNLGVLGGAVTGLGNRIAADLLPGLTAVTNDLAGVEGKTTGLQATLNGLATTAGFVGKVFLSVFESIGFLFDITAGALASLGAKLVALFTGDFDVLKELDKNFKQELIDATEKAASNINQIWSDSNSKRVQGAKKTNADLVKGTKKRTDQEIALEKAAALKKRQIDSAKANAAQDSTNAIFTFAKTAAGKNAKAQKKIALGEAVISGALAVAKANSSAPWPFNLPAIAFAVAQGVAQVAAINAQGFQDGGIVPGTSFTGDRVLAGLNSGEVILNAAQQDNLVGQLQGASQSPTQVTVEMDSRVLLEFMIDANKDGRLPITQGSIV